MPSNSFNASQACIKPMIPGTTPSTPASSQLGAEPADGGSGKRQR